MFIPETASPPAIGASAPTIANILRLAREGKSATAIGKELGCGKNSVIGKVHRAGIRLGAVNGWDERPRQPRKRGDGTGVRRGENHHAAKLNTDAVYVIRDTMAELAARYGVGFSTLHAVAARRLWRHLPDVRSEATIADAGQASDMTP